MGLKEGQLSDRGKLQCDLGPLLFSEDRRLFLATVLCLCGVEAGPGRHQHPRRGPGHTGGTQQSRHSNTTQVSARAQLSVSGPCSKSRQAAGPRGKL